MPSTIVKLCSSDARAWAHNQPLWFRQDGSIERAVSRAEQFALSRALERTKDQKRSFRLELKIHEVTRPPSGYGNRRTVMGQSTVPSQTDVPVMQCAFEVSMVGRRRVVTIWNGDLRYGTSRESLRARLLADHGECVLHGRNGKAMGVLRDPFVRDRPRNTGRRVQLSRNPNDPPPGQRAPVVASMQRTARPRVSHPSRPLYSPLQCPNDCRGQRGGGEWALAKGTRPPTSEEHHPICKFAAAWAETLESATTGYVLYDLELSTVARAAEDIEVREADQVEARMGIRQITVAGKLFAVLKADDAGQAEKDARGDTVSESDAVPAAPLLLLDESQEIARSAPSEAAVLFSELDDAAATSTPAERADWPDFETLSRTPDEYRQRAEVTAASYLARAPGQSTVTEKSGARP